MISDITADGRCRKFESQQRIRTPDVTIDTFAGTLSAVEGSRNPQKIYVFEKQCRALAWKLPWPSCLARGAIVGYYARDTGSNKLLFLLAL